MNANGVWAWAIRAGSTEADTGRGISALSDGSSIVIGLIAGNTTFGTTTLVNVGNTDLFVAKVNANGTWAWATIAGGTGADVGRGISALSDGSSVVTGSIAGTATFGTTSLSSAGSNDVFVAKMNANGTWAWAAKAGGGVSDVGRSISALSDGSSVASGDFSGTATFGTTTLVSAGNTDVFVAKIHANGTWVWATKASGTLYQYGFGISAISDGSSVVNGVFNGNATFGTITLVSAGDYDIFVAKMNPDGTWAWATRAGSTGPDYSRGISTLLNGSCVVIGEFSNSVTFGTPTLVSAGNTDIFTARMNADGTWAWATRAGGTGYDYGNSVSTLPNGSYSATGAFASNAIFGATTLTSAGITDVFVAHYSTTTATTTTTTPASTTTTTTAI